MRRIVLAIGLLATSCGAADVRAPTYHLISGSVPLNKGPDGNTVILDAPEGLIVVDTGRHPEHAKAILDHAKERGRPVAAIVNTHWHMDHVQGNADILAAFPNARVYGTTAIDGALATFLEDGRKGAEARLIDPKTPKERLPEIHRYLDRMAKPDSVRPTVPVHGTDKVEIGGETLDVHVAPFAVTEADLWLHEPRHRLAIVGDLVVDIVPFMDTACADGWLKALEEIERSDFATLIPGHGPAMSRSDFLEWKQAFKDYVECGRSAAPKDECVTGWERGAARFIPDSHRAYVREAADYYITTRLRSNPEERQRYCKPLKKA